MRFKKENSNRENVNHHNAMKKEKKPINKRYMKKGAYSATLTVVVIAIVVIINLVLGQIPTKYTEFDISTGKLYTIGDTTKEILKNLDDEITIYYLVQSGNEDANIEKILDQYEEYSDKITIVKKDPVVSPTFISQYTDESIYENSLIVESGQRSKVVDYSTMYETEMDYTTYQTTTTGFDGEGQLTSAINYVISDSLPVVYYVEGHNESGLPSALNERIQKANMELQSLSLLTAESVPEDAACLLLNSPETDYSEDETKKILEYLENGGKALVLTDYIGDKLDNYTSILEEYGIEVVNGIVVETDSNMYVQQPYYLVPEIASSEITYGMTGGSANVLLSACQGFRISEEASETMDITALLSPSENAYVKTTPQNMTTYELEEGDEEGSFVVAASVSRTVSADEASTDKSKTTQLVCIASSSIMDTNMNSMVSDGNYSFYMNSLTWLVGADDTELVSIPVKSVAVDYLTITAGKSSLLGLFFAIVLPFACLIGGGVICHKRKTR